MIQNTEETPKTKLLELESPKDVSPQRREDKEALPDERYSFDQLLDQASSVLSQATYAELHLISPNDLVLRKNSHQVIYDTATVDEYDFTAEKITALLPKLDKNGLQHLVIYHLNEGGMWSARSLEALLTSLVSTKVHSLSFIGSPLSKQDEKLAVLNTHLPKTPIRSLTFIGDDLCWYMNDFSHMTGLTAITQLTLNCFRFTEVFDEEEGKDFANWISQFPLNCLNLIACNFIGLCCSYPQHASSFLANVLAGSITKLGIIQDNDAINLPWNEHIAGILKNAINGSNVLQLDFTYTRHQEGFIVSLANNLPLHVLQIILTKCYSDVRYNCLSLKLQENIQKMTEKYAYLNQHIEEKYDIDAEVITDLIFLLAYGNNYKKFITSYTRFFKSAKPSHTARKNSANEEGLICKKLAFTND